MNSGISHLAATDRSTLSSRLVLPLLLLTLFGVAPLSAEGPRVLLLSKSSGYEHGVISHKKSARSHVDQVLEAMAAREGFEVTTTKNAGLINALDLAAYDVVIFFTTGNLFRSGGDGPGIFAGDGEPAMPESGLDDLLAWIEAGGGFMGFHCATDTFKSSDLDLTADVITPYTEMIGGEFKTHGQQFEGTLRLVDRQHPVAAHIQDGWKKMDEWYVIHKYNRKKMHVVARLDPGNARKDQAQIYDIPDYPVIWTMERGQGRVYYNAMGHREDVWSDPVFQSVVLDAILWSSGRGATASPPNLSE